MLKKSTNSLAAGRLLVAAGLLAVSTVSAAPAQCTGCAKPSFGPALPWFGPIGGANGYTAADFDQDGFLDIAISSPSGHATGIWFGDGRGTFSTPVFVADTNNTFYFVASGDLNHDGYPDLVASNFGGFEVFVADGQGGFVPTDSGATDRGEIVVEDFDGDGLIDLLTAEALFRGLGDGRFRAPVALTGGPYSWLIATGDFNGDGLPDAVMSTYLGAVVLLADGNGGFSPAGSFSPDSAAIRTGAAADFDNDGDTDLAVLVAHDFSPPSEIQILLGNGAGGLVPGDVITPVNAFESLVSADFDQDGSPDILTSGEGLFRGLGDGSFEAPLYYDVAGLNVVGDFNNDGLPDAAAAGGVGFAVLLSRATGGFAAPEPTPFLYEAGGVAIADVTGDGARDVIATVADFTAPSVIVFPGLGGESLGPPATYPVTGAATSLAVADFTEGGALDLAVGSAGQIAMFEADGAGGFLAPVYFDTTVGPSALVAGLFDADGHQDLVVVGGGVEILLGNGAGGLSAPVHVSDVLGNAARVADFNGDGKADVAVFGPYGTLDVFLGQGDGTFGAPLHTSTPTGGDSLAVADFDGDGSLDIAVGNYYGYQIPIFFGQGGGVFGDPVLVDVNASTFLAVEAADFNGDGKADLAVLSPEAQALLVLPGDGAGGFGAESRWLAGGYPRRIATGDLDSDGKPDAVAVGGTVLVFRNTNCEVRRIGFAANASTCAAPGVEFSAQPALAISDDGGNVITCDAGIVSASIVPGTGTAGASLGGDTTVAAVAGIASFTDLAIDLAGTGYRIQFSHPGTGVTRSAVTVANPPPAPAASNSGPFCQGQDLNLYATTVPGAVYRWTGPNGFFSTAQSPVIPDATLAASGLYSVSAIVDGCTSSAATTTVDALPPTPGPDILGQAQVCFGSRLLLRAADPAFRFQWFLDGEPIPDATGEIYTVVDASFADVGDYAVASSDATGCTTALSSPFPVSVVFCHAEALVLAVDPGGNGILEPGETAVIDPTWKNRDIVPLALSGTATDFSGPAGASYVIVDPTADYGSLDPKTSADCLTATGDCYSVMASFSGARPATHWDAFFDETPGVDPAHTWILHVGESFTDVPQGHPFYSAIETVLHNAVTAGCTPSAYCPAAGVTRAQMAVLLLKAKYGAAYQPPPATGTVFADVPADAFAAAWIEEMENQNITAGCGGGNYCPDQIVTRAQMAVFLFRAEHSGVSPCTGIFADVPCPDGFAVDYIEALYARGVTGGCNASPLLYCPSNPNTRGQMAVFLTRWFDLALYAP